MADTISQLGERGLLRALEPILRAHTEGLPLGTGDDVAITEGSGDRRLVWTIDTMIEGTHFRWWKHPLCTPAAVATKLVASNISDLASKGARPLYALISLGVPGTASTTAIAEFYAGIDEALRSYNVRLIGGDTVSAPQWCLTITAIGDIARDATIAARHRVKPGQNLYITGAPGESGAGFELLERGIEIEEPHGSRLIGRCLSPTARPLIGAALVARFHDLAMIDLSDGLGQDAARLSVAGNACVVIEENRLPFTRALIAAAEKLRVPSVDFALYGGEDYELCFCTMADEFMVYDALRDCGDSTRVTRIGRVEKGSGLYLERPNSERVEIHPKGFEHFA